MGVTTKEIHLFQFALRPSVPPPVCRPSLPLPPLFTARIPPCMDVVSSFLDPLLCSHGGEEKSLRNYLKLEVEKKKIKQNKKTTCLQLLEQSVKGASAWHRYSGKKCAVVYRNVMNVLSFQLEGGRGVHARSEGFLFFSFCVRKNVCLCLCTVCFVAAHVEVEHGALSSAY